MGWTIEFSHPPYEAPLGFIVSKLRCIGSGSEKWNDFTQRHTSNWWTQHSLILSDPKATFAPSHTGKSEDISGLTGHLVCQKSKCHRTLNIIYSVLSFSSQRIISKPQRHTSEFSKPEAVGLNRSFGIKYVQGSKMKPALLASCTPLSKMPFTTSKSHPGCDQNI